MEDNLINKYIEKINNALNDNEKLPNNIINDLINFKNILTDNNVSVDKRKLTCVLVDDLLYRIGALRETDNVKKRR